ncbi:MAG: hypothetical protein ACXU68_03805 [Croceibacterium sp.]
MITPHLASAMAMFGLFATFYVIAPMLEIWLAYRPYIVERAHKRSDLLRRVYTATCGRVRVSFALGQVQLRPTWVCSGNRLATVHVATGTVAIGRGDTRIERGLSARTWHPSASEEWGCGLDRMCRDEVCGIGVAT